MEIIYKNIDDIKPYSGNPRRNDKAVERVAESIRQFGFKQPILIDKNDVIIAGHTRQLAAKKLKMLQVPCIYADDLTPEQVRAYRLADNKVAEFAEWDFDLLNQELLNIPEIDMTAFGFTMPKEAAEVQEDDYEINVPAEPRTKPGDIYKLGRHFLMCGDSTQEINRETALRYCEADTLFYDPPYDREDLYESIPENVDGTLLLSYDHKHFAKAILEATKKHWTAQFELIWDCCQSWYTPNRPLAKHKTIAVFKDDPAWNFDKAIIKDGKKREPKIVHNTRGSCDYKPLDGAIHMRTCEPFPNTALTDEHGQGKPLEWIKAILGGVNAKKVIDYFGGTGTTLIACEIIGTQCCMIEKEPEYCDVIIDRWEALTGGKAERVN